MISVLIQVKLTPVIITFPTKTRYEIFIALHDSTFLFCRLRQPIRSWRVQKLAICLVDAVNMIMWMQIHHLQPNKLHLLVEVMVYLKKMYLYPQK